ncbi:MAG: hypothetical protein E6J56_04225 [Deltaproteobacteria bacterium]|nr:MAG: hypothetical protein E6J56_04225 [Deltaproteobacteria bacterium]
MPRTFVQLAVLIGLLTPAPSDALYHLAHIHEIMSGITGDPSVQYVEIRMDSGFQNLVGNTRLTVFDCSGRPTVLLTIPNPSTPAGQVPNQGAGRHWIMGTSTLAGATSPSVTPDFTFSPGIPTSCGMVCWGGPADPLTFTSRDPSTWDASDPNNYIDCVPYGPYTGPQRTACASTPPLTVTPGGGAFSLTRNTNNCYDFALACPTPTNNGPSGGAEVTGTFRPCAPPCVLDVDENGRTEVATDVVYIARRLLGLTPVPPSFRVIDPAIPPDVTIAARVDAAGTSLDVDKNGRVEVATDVVYIARTLLGLTPVPPSFRVIDPNIPPDDMIAGNIRALCAP